MKGTTLSKRDAIALKMKLDVKKEKVLASLEDGDVDKDDI